MEQQSATLLAALRRPAASSESKLSLLNSIKSDIKHYRVPASCQGTLFDCLNLAISQSSSINLVTAAFATLGHLIKRLKIQDPEDRAIAEYAPTLLPALADRLHDLLDVHKIGASQALSDIWTYCPANVERTIREHGLGNTDSHAKIAAMQWILRMHQDAGLHVKSFVPSLVACLENPDEGVRSEAKATIVDLFRGAAVVAKNDLTKQLDLHGTRQSVVSDILSQIGHKTASVAPTPALAQKEPDFAASTRSTLEQGPSFRDSVSTDLSRSVQPQEEVNLTPMFVSSQKELEDLYHAMEPDFEGRESEENWLLRDRHVTRLRCLVRGNAPSDYFETHMAALKCLHEGILKAANSLRTTMATNGCLLVQDLARTLGPALDPLVEKWLPSFIKASSATKQIFAQQSATTADAILRYVSYHIRLVQHVFHATQDKNKQTRSFATGWLLTLLNKNEGSKTQFDHTGGLNLAEKSIKKGLNDADPKVKEGMRATYWAYARIWPEKANHMMESLEPKVRSALEKDSHNPNASASNFAASTNSRPSGTKSSLLREQIKEQRAKARSGNLPPRPATAAANPSPARTRSIPNLNARAQLSSAPQGPYRVPSNLSVTSSTTDRSTSSSTRPMLSGAARRPAKRPEISRPATADPYASRRLMRSETMADTSSPVISPRATGPTISTSLRVQANGSPATSPQRPLANDRARPRSQYDEPSLSESPDAQALENFTFVLPNTASTAMGATASSARKQRPPVEKEKSDSGVDGGLHTHASPTGQRGISPYKQSSPSNGRPGRASSAEPGQGSRTSSPRSTTRKAASPAPADRRSRSPGVAGSPTKAPSRNASPVASGNTGAAIVRQGSPLKNVTATAPSPVIGSHEEGIEIYEDPQHGEINDNKDSGHDANGPSSEEPLAAAQVLNELPVNESNQQPPDDSIDRNQRSASDQNPTTGSVVLSSPDLAQLSPPLSPDSKKQKQMKRKLIQSGIERLLARTLDSHGFRRLQELIRVNDPFDLFGSEGQRFEDFMLALCEYMSSSNHDSKPPATELRRQAITLLKNFLTNDGPVYRKWIKSGRWGPRCLSASLDARLAIEGSGIIVKDIEILSQQAVSISSSQDVLDCVSKSLSKASTIEAEAEAGDWDTASLNSGRASAHTVALGLRNLSCAVKSDNAMRPDQLSMVLELLAARLRSPDAEVRKAAVELATVVFAHWNESVDHVHLVNGHQDGDAHGNGDADREDANGFHDAGRDGVSGSSDEMGTKTAAAASQKQSFWTALEKAPGGLSESSRNLIVYYIARTL